MEIIFVCNTNRLIAYTVSNEAGAKRRDVSE